MDASGIATEAVRSTDGVLAVRWPLFVVTPCASAFFWLSYLVLLPAFSRRAVPVRYGNFNKFNERCWRQNINSLIHTSFAVVLLCAVLFTDGSMFADRLYPHDNLLLFFDISLSLGYFTFALPMATYMAFVLKAGFPYGSPIMSFHHVLVVAAQIVFLLTQYPGFYMAASGALFELTNVFFIPHVLMEQLQIFGAPRDANGLLLVLAYSLFRVFACTALCALSARDLTAFAPAHPLGWPAALGGLGCFYGLTLMSWSAPPRRPSSGGPHAMGHAPRRAATAPPALSPPPRRRRYWYVRDILPALHAGLQEAAGDEYHHACCPAPLRRWAWRRLSAEGRALEREQREQQQQQLELLRHLRGELHAHEPAA